MATSPWIFITGRRTGKLAALKQFPFFFPPAYENPRRHLGQVRPNRLGTSRGAVRLLLSRLKAPEFGVPNASVGVRNLNVGVRVLQSRRSEPQSWRSEPRCQSLRTPKLRFRTPKSEFRTPKLKFRTSTPKSLNSKARVQNLEVRVLNFEVEARIPKSLQSMAHEAVCSHANASATTVWSYPALDGALNFCCREEKGRETV